MSNGVFTLDAESLKGALVSTLLMAILGVLGYVVGLGDVYKIDLHALVNVGVMSLSTGIISLIKNFLSDNKGVFAGMIKTQ